MKVVLRKQGEQKKLIFLGALALIGIWVFYTNVLSSPDSGPSSSAGSAGRASIPAPAAAPTLTGSAPVQRRGITARRGSEFRPVLHPNRPEERIDPTKVDPALRLDLLAKVQSVSLEGGSRNLFQFGAAAPPVPLTPIPKEPKIPINKTAVMAPPVANPGPPPPPPPPPIPLKYYGYTNARGETRKKAFFLDGEDVIVAWEGDMVKNRYRIVRVGVSSVEMEDTQFKNNQTLPIVPEAMGG